MRIFGAPGRYVQGAGTLRTLRDELSVLGDSVFIIADSAVEHLLTQICAGGLDSEFRVEGFKGEITASLIDDLSIKAKNFKPDVIVGMGGGKAIDSAKGVALELNRPVVVVPTIASNDAPTSRLIVIYDDSHQLAEVRMLERNPAIVLVDTEIIVKAPARFFSAGMGDALSKTYEAEACLRSGGKNFFGTRPPVAATTLAKQCHDTILSNGRIALQAVRQGTITDAFEDVVEASILLSGLGFESGGLSLAHAMTRGLTAHKSTSKALHGEMVAYGLVVQLLHERQPPERVSDIVSFLSDIDLPKNLLELGGYHASLDDMAVIAEATLKAPYIAQADPPISRESLISAMQRAEKLCSDR